MMVMKAGYNLILDLKYAGSLVCLTEFRKAENMKKCVLSYTLDFLHGEISASGSPLLTVFEMIKKYK
jgi:hypothetical protein